VAPQVSCGAPHGSVLYAGTLLKSFMMKVSTLKRFGAIARVAGRKAGKTRMAGAIWRGLRVTGSSFGRVLGILWLEVTGFVFLCLSGIGALALAREYTKYQAGQVGSARLILAVCFTVTFAWFGVSSFWRARHKG
jgi:hypothetical protein